jgi:carboxyl-terminal processing protease
VAKYQSPSGKKIQDDAVTPNVLVAPSIDQYLAEAEAPETPQNAQKPETHTDDQLSKALDLLKQKNA